MDGKSIAVEVRGDPTSLEGCDVLYLASGQETHRAKVTRSGVVVITDRAPEARRGHINFELVQGKARFRIDADRINGIGVSVSSQLMRVALQ